MPKKENERNKAKSSSSSSSKFKYLPLDIWTHILALLPAKTVLKISCNGLLLVEKGGSSRLRLWNPCIRKSLVLPWSPLPRGFFGRRYLFGFAPNSQDYKAVSITFERSEGIEPSKMYYAVYTLRDQQWTVRKDPLNVTNLYNSNTIMAFYSLPTAVFFRGTAYWLGQNDFGQHNNQRYELTHLGSFNFDTENVNFLELPFSLDEEGSLRFVFLLGGLLAVFSISEVASSIWVLEQDNKKGSWTLWFSGQSSRNGYQLFKDSVQKIFYCERNGGYFVYGKHTYNIASCRVQELKKSMSSYVKLETYSESLVLFKGYKSYDLRDIS
ncbi:uncharacterized protein LOC141587579 [Silene latifolia]|uniref:uncharacterized protein LOC141587579 n=1 Tax=Silene latifolia TaxID=37657 RepID=UPI003D77BBFB